jgi:N-methylhydantoinase B
MGVVREYQLLEDGIAVTLHLERSFTPAWGLFGGGEALGPAATLFEGDASEPLPLKVSLRGVPKGAVVRVETGGGGGYGTPE